jgi:hypothetical protein
VSLQAILVYPALKAQSYGPYAPTSPARWVLSSGKSKTMIPTMDSAISQAQSAAVKPRVMTASSANCTGINPL